MAYGNWGAWVFRDGEHMPAHEDQTPFREAEYEAGYAQAFGVARLSEGLAAVREGRPVPDSAKLDRAAELGPQHAVLGSADLRLCGYKSYPRLYVAEADGAGAWPMDDFATEWADWDDGCEFGRAWRGELRGHRLAAQVEGDAENRIWLELVEPGGVHWTSLCGYCYGAGHDEEPPTAWPPRALLL